jgi:hypothetical protein
LTVERNVCTLVSVGFLRHDAWEEELDRRYAAGREEANHVDGLVIWGVENATVV